MHHAFGVLFDPSKAADSSVAFLFASWLGINPSHNFDKVEN
jgi:hypothetical protein